MARWLLVLVLFPQQDPRLLVGQLGDDDPAVRDRATRQLRLLGDDALDELMAAADHPDAEIRARAADLVRHIDQSQFIKSLAFLQRHGKIHLVASEQDPRSNEAFTDGAEFRFQETLWKPEGTVTGTILRTTMTPRLEGEIEWSVAAVRSGGKDLPIETCRNHSPELIYLPGPPPARSTVAVKGVRRWLCDVPVGFKDPADGDSRRVGAFRVTIRWPRVVIEADVPQRLSILEQMLVASDILGVPKKGFEAEPQFPEAPADEPAIFFPEAVEPNTAWCGCLKPDRSPRSVSTASRRVVAVPWSRIYLLHHLDVLTVVVHVPVEEPFEATSPPK